MTSGIFVKYDTTTFSPTPLVNYSQQPVEFGYVYGYNTDISLEGQYTGITTTGAAVSFLTGVFGNQFKALTVTDDQSNTLYSWSGVTVDSINFDTSPYFQGAFIKYTVKLKSYSIPSGVIDPTNEFTFTQNEDNSVTATHRVGARGVRNSAGAFDNAVAFVRQFTGKDPYANCAPIFVPSGSGILTSLSETINRADGQYSVTETYRYNSGASTPYFRNSTLNTSEMIDSEYLAIDYNLKLQGSPVNQNLSTVLNSLPSIINLTDIQNEFGISTSGWVKNTYSANVDSGTSSVDINISYVSGATTGAFFDYEVSCDTDYLAGTQLWKIDGEFKCYGPIDFRYIQLSNWSSANVNLGIGNWRTYLSGLIVSSPLFAIYNQSNFYSPNLKVKVDENQNLATLKLSAEMENKYEPLGLTELRYSWDVEPTRWIYELMPSANIEGSYVIQDLQTRSQTRQKMSVMSKSAMQGSGLSLITGYLNNFAGTYVQSGTPTNVGAFLVESAIETGTYDVNASNTWLGADLGISIVATGLKSIGSLSDVAPVRTAGYSFGY